MLQNLLGKGEFRCNSNMNLGQICPNNLPRPNPQPEKPTGYMLCPDGGRRNYWGCAPNPPAGWKLQNLFLSFCPDGKIR